MRVSITTTGAKAVERSFTKGAIIVGPAVRKVVGAFGELLKTRIMANASGRPGPNAPTGDYLRSWNVQMQGNADYARANVGTNAPQGRRLEYGFVGADSLGRVYNQPPFPHVGPAVDATAEPFIAAIEAAAIASIQGA